jgi:hypothetical protein
MKIKFIQGGITIIGFGKTELNKTVDLPKDLAKSLIESGIAKEVKNSKIKEEETSKE